MRRRSLATRWTAIACLLGLALTSCNSADDDQVEVYVAASLTASFEELATTFESTHPDVDIVIIAGGSPSLVRQLIEGAPGEILATANQETMAQAVAAEVAFDPKSFAVNEAVLVATADLADTSLAELDSLVLAVCDPSVPCGAAAVQLFAELDITPTPVTLETSVRGVLAKLSLGEVDAAVVYRTDLADTLADQDFRLFSAASNVAVSVISPIAATAEDVSDEARMFLAFVMSEEAQNILTDYGFGTP